jgi:coenzyme F420-dependent glucose-6-phosphate dehydrogenase
VRAFREGGGEGKPMFLQSALSYAPTEEEALRGACERWPVCTLDVDALENTATPQDFAAQVGSVRPRDVMDKLRVSADLKRHIDWLQNDFELGFDAVYLHHVGGHMERFIDVFGSRVIPQVLGVSRSR